MKGSKVEVISDDGVKWLGLVVSEPDHFLKDFDGDHLSYWYVLVMDKGGCLHSVEMDMVTIIITDKGTLASYALA